MTCCQVLFQEGAGFLVIYEVVVPPPRLYISPYWSRPEDRTNLPVSLQRLFSFRYDLNQRFSTVR
jgi:hypothetical protein